MTTIHIIETAEERETVKRVFRQRIRDQVAKARGESADIGCNHFGGEACYDDEGSAMLFNSDGALVYDTKNGGDPDLGWVVYDFRGEAKCHAICERDLAGLVNELPNDVFPF